MRIVIVIAALLFLSTPAFAHGGTQPGHADAAATPSLAAAAAVPADHHAPAAPAPHRHDPSGSMHCSVSSACAPVFTVAVAIAGMPSGYAVTWALAPESLLRAVTPEREPPVPRFFARS